MSKHIEALEKHIKLLQNEKFALEVDHQAAIKLYKKRIKSLKEALERSLSGVPSSSEKNQKGAYDSPNL